MDMAAAMGIELLTEEQYRNLQTLGNFDLKTSSWVKTPADIRKLGGALFGDFKSVIARVTRQSNAKPVSGFLSKNLSGKPSERRCRNGIAFGERICLGEILLPD